MNHYPTLNYPQLIEFIFNFFLIHPTPTLVGYNHQHLKKQSTLLNQAIYYYTCNQLLVHGTGHQLTCLPLRTKFNLLWIAQYKWDRALSQLMDRASPQLGASKSFHMQLTKTRSKLATWLTLVSTATTCPEYDLLIRETIPAPDHHLVNTFMNEPVVYAALVLASSAYWSTLIAHSETLVTHAQALLNALLSARIAVTRTVVLIANHQPLAHHASNAFLGLADAYTCFAHALFTSMAHTFGASGAVSDSIVSYRLHYNDLLAILNTSQHRQTGIWHRVARSCFNKLQRPFFPRASSSNRTSFIPPNKTKNRKRSDLATLTGHFSNTLEWMRQQVPEVFDLAIDTMDSNALIALNRLVVLNFIQHPELDTSSCTWYTSQQRSIDQLHIEMQPYAHIASLYDTLKTRILNLSGFSHEWTPPPHIRRPTATRMYLDAVTTRSRSLSVPTPPLCSLVDYKPLISLACAIGDRLCPRSIVVAAIQAAIEQCQVNKYAPLPLNKVHRFTGPAKECVQWQVSLSDAYRMVIGDSLVPGITTYM